MTHSVRAQEFLTTVRVKLGAAAGNMGAAIADFQELASDIFIAFVVLGNLKVKVVAQRDYLEYRLGPRSAPNELGDKVDGVRMWFSPETIRDFVSGCPPVCEEEIFSKSDPISPADSLTRFGKMISPILTDLQALFHPDGFGQNRKRLQAYESERIAQIIEISRRRYPHI